MALRCQNLAEASAVVWKDRILRGGGADGFRMEEHAIPECCEGTESRCVVRRTPRNQVHAGERQRCISGTKDGVGLAQPVLALWLGKSGDGRH